MRDVSVLDGNSYVTPDGTRFLRLMFESWNVLVVEVHACHEDRPHVCFPPLAILCMDVTTGGVDARHQSYTPEEFALQTQTDDDLLISPGRLPLCEMLGQFECENNTLSITLRGEALVFQVRDAGGMLGGVAVDTRDGRLVGVVSGREMFEREFFAGELFSDSDDDSHEERRRWQTADEPTCRVGSRAGQARRR